MRRDPLVGEARREVADLALLGRELAQAHRRRSGTTFARRRGGAERRESTTEPSPPSAAASARRAGDAQPPAEALEAQHLPALGARDAAELGVRVDRDRVADEPQHRQVGLRVRVGPRGGEVDALALGELADRLRLALAVGERPAGAAGVVAVDDLGDRADRAVEREHDRHQLGHLLRRGGADEDRPARVLVPVGDLEHLRVQPRQHAGEHVGRQPLQVAHAHALEHLADPLAQRVGARVGRAAQAEEDVLPRVARELAARDEPGLVRGAPELERRRARDQRAVEVEERRAPLLGPPQRAAARAAAGGCAGARSAQTRTITASPWPPPEQIAAQP